MLDGVTPFPADAAARYRRLGYWRDKSLAEEFRAVFRMFQRRVAIIDRDRRITYSELDCLSDNLALNLLSAGLKPIDRVVVQLPNVAEFVILYFALQKIGCIPIAALPSHRFAEISQFVELSGATACVVPGPARDFSFTGMLSRILKQSSTLRFGIVLGEAPDGFLSLAEMISRPATLPRAVLADIAIDPTDPAIFQLSGGTTGIPKLIPRTHNDYAYNSRAAAAVCEIDRDSVLLLVLPIAHNLPLACPGIQGFLLHGAKVVVSTSTKPDDMCALIEEHGVTHLTVVPSLLIRFLNSNAVTHYYLSSLRVIQSGGQCLQPEVRLLAHKLIPSAFIQENFGMSEGVLMFVRKDDPEDVRLGTVGRPVSPDDEVRLLDENEQEVPFGETGELCCRGPYTLHGYFGVPEYNQRAFTADRFYKSGDLMRQHPSGNYIVEGRKKDLINRGGEKISAEEVENLILSHPSVKDVACVPIADPALGERMCACIVLRDGKRLEFDELKDFLMAKEIAKFKLPERLEIFPDFPLSTFGKVSKQKLSEVVSSKIALEQSSHANH